VPDVTSKNGQVRQAAERVAVNMPIQGTAADILKRAMLDAQRALDARPASSAGLRARMILTVHDELLFEVPREEAEDVAALVKTVMEGAATLAVPLTVDIGSAGTGTRLNTRVRGGDWGLGNSQRQGMSPRPEPRAPSVRSSGCFL